ncbi:MAG: holin [Clostridiales bacterium]|nr:holin [Clostridiales bacterium]
MDINFLNEYLVLIVVGVCLCIGYIIKTSLTFIPNKYIPLIMAVIGIGANVINEGTFNITVLLGGMFSGLASTGLYEAFRNVLGNKTE